MIRRQSDRKIPGAVRVIAAALFGAAFAGAVSCTQQQKPEHLEIPRGYVRTIMLERGGYDLRFGPFVGYYFAPSEPGSFEQLDFLCFNEKSFYTEDLPPNSLLFKGTALLRTLPETSAALPRSNRINPVFFDEADPEWLKARPKQPEGFLHFHSCYTASGPSPTGFWLRHVAVTNFTYDMGGRVSEDSPLYHEVTSGLDLEFARIIEFDSGPAESE